MNRINRTKISEEIVNEITRLIQQGYFVADQKIPSEKELSDLFGVGRSSVREALSVLQSADILETRQGEGTYVRKVELRDYIHPLALSLVAVEEQTLQLLEVRKILEQGTVLLACQRRNESDFLEIRQALLHFESEISMGRSGEEADFAFHIAIARASKNPLLIQILENLTQVMKQSIAYTYSKNKDNSRLEQVASEHRRIFSAMEAGDIAAATEAMNDHLEIVRLKIVSSNQSVEKSLEK